MNQAFINALAAHGVTLVPYVALFNPSGVEISGGSYARQPASWTGAADIKNLAADIDFPVPAGAVVHEWRGFSALTGGTDYGGAVLPADETFSNAGTFKLLAASTFIDLDLG